MPLFRIHLIRLLIFVLGIFPSMALFAADPLPWSFGEKLTYHFYWGFIMVGRGTFEVEKKDSNSLFTVHVQSNDFISALYPVNDELRSLFNHRKMESINFNQDRREGNDRVWEETFFYYHLKLASTESYITGEKKWFDIPEKQVQDKLSTIYYMRCLDWKTRTSATTTLGNDKGNHDVKITKLKTETVETDDFRPIPTFQVEPNMEYLSGFVKKGKMLVWVSDDTFKIPVRVEAKLPIGTVRAILVKVENVKDWPYDRER